METIFAQATAMGRAGVSVVRISGPNAQCACLALAGDVPKPRFAAYRKLWGADGDFVDQALVFFFESPASFTGDDVVELHLHGSIAITRRILTELSLMEGFRLAEPGEFTRKALENGKLDLTQVEGLSDLIDAETEAQRKQALRVLDGELGAQVEIWRSKLIRAAALLEATIDFADEDVPVDVSSEVRDLLGGVRQDLEGQIAGTSAAERIRLGFEVAIIGEPNVGKSTLLNRLAGREAAITSNIAGTTRDVIEVRMEIGGLPVTLLDTAGIRESSDEIEKIGIDRALSRAGNADLRVVMLEQGSAAPVRLETSDIVIHPKADLTGEPFPFVSGLSGSGIDELLARIGQRLTEMAAGAGLATHLRHSQAMTDALVGLLACLELLDSGPDAYDLAAEELRIGVRSLEALVGLIDVETLLGEIFANFCVGK
ncbi:tRNA uridine-5-carboxymethylaminomethyl(34) synthesis GTPase MnmE [Sulfitobacter sp. SK012]|uniref:tRNA uridine-5-carboxymethylaminomethyl(34) synthesis GTPase MnmE n=1 Tax=Sulfitobacter sp. SK012 TaxID=1389005 RepID=UPI000E0C59E2|nr:tRNA uridine-5-carboxymethylaminomethyl(34) synthesis GTPase MnmE [Sulfitobacter sp. SK012]AXI44623.1 tRNA uridine-5-carboxymethylaminomethyl(34) synthesis GTPase MnmE [Sulfitobacter sp. SK012]